MLIRTQKFPITRQRLSTALRMIPQQPDILSNANMRKARVEFICGSNVLTSIRGWLLAANIIADRKRGKCILTDFGQKLAFHDVHMTHSWSWWAFHLNICFSEISEPYRSLFQSLGESSDWVELRQLPKKILTILKGHDDDIPATRSIDSVLDGVIKMFRDGGALSDLGIIELRKHERKYYYRASTPLVTDQVIIYALALARYRHFRTATTIHFSELIDIHLHYFLCLSSNVLRKRLRSLSKSNTWEGYLKFLEGKNLDSIEFRDQLHPNIAVLHLLQETEDTWI